MKSIETIIRNLRVAMTDARQNESHFESWMILNEAICDAIDALAEESSGTGQPKLSDYEPDGMHHNKPQKRPQNCGTGYCSCIECLFEQPAQQEQEPFGYFKPEPFGWTDCAETDEGAIALYERPQPAQQQEPVAVGSARCPRCWEPITPPASKPWVGLTDEQLYDSIRNPADDLLDHIYEYGTAAEGVIERIVFVARAAIEAAHGIKE